MATTKLRKIGNSVGVIIPADVLSHKNMKEGDEVHVLETPEGVSITPYDPSFEEMLDDADEFLRSHRNAFRELSK
jgi:putative addiction module antidote